MNMELNAARVSNGVIDIETIARKRQ